MTELERCIEFIRRIEDRAAAQREDFRFGVAHLNDRLPRVWSRNYLLAEKNLDTATAGLLAAEADRILGGAGLGHRKVEINDAEVGERLDPGFRDLGWNVQCDLIMVARREPDVQADLSRVEEVHVEELEPAWAEGTRSEPYGSDEEVVEQLVAANRVMMEAVATLGRHKGIALVFGLPLRGFLGWFVTRTYHLYQLPLFSRKLRVVTDWTVALFFRRDIAELGMLGHPTRLGDD